jgi:hypothetical protein
MEPCVALAHQAASFQTVIDTPQRFPESARHMFVKAAILNSQHALKAARSSAVVWSIDLVKRVAAPGGFRE